MATEYKKFLRDENVENGILLGKYNDKDVYSIDSNVKEQLVELRKLITLYKQDYMLCEAKILDTTLKFKVKFFVDALESEKYASLYLLESYNNIGKKVELETFLVNLKTANDFNFMDNLKDAFHVLTKEDLGEGKDVENHNIILEKLLSTKKTISKEMINEMGLDNRKYCNELLKILRKSKNYPKLEKIIKQRMAGIKADKNTAKYFALLKEILDEIVVEYYDEFEDEVKKWLEAVNQNYVMIYMNKKKEVQKPKVKQMESSSQKKAKAEKKKAAGGPKKKKDKEKKKSNKKDDKKNNPLNLFEIAPFVQHYERLKYDAYKMPNKYKKKVYIPKNTLDGVKENNNTTKVKNEVGKEDVFGSMFEEEFDFDETKEDFDTIIDDRKIVPETTKHTEKDGPERTY